jgi:hypothetical protein
MTFIYKLLDPTDLTDVEQFNQILNQYVEHESISPNPIYLYEHMIRFSNWLQKQFLDVSTKDFVVSARFTDGHIDEIMVGYKIEIAWYRTTVEDVLPYWVVGLWYKKQGSWKSPYDEFFSIEKLLLEHFEKQQYTKGFIVIKAPKKALRITDSVQAKDYALNVFSQTIPAVKYDFMIEKIFTSQKDIDNYKFTALKPILPRRFIRPVMLMSLDLHYAHRIKNDPPL